MTELPGLVKAAAAACAFLMVSYAVSVSAGPDLGTEDLGRGAPGSPAGVYARDPSGAPRRPAHARGPDSVGAVEAGGPGAQNAATAPLAVPVSARTGIAEAPTATASPEPVTASGTASVPVPPDVSAVEEAPPVQSGRQPRHRWHRGHKDAGSGSGTPERPSRSGRSAGASHGHGHGSDGCTSGPARPAKARAAAGAEPPHGIRHRGRR